MKVLKVILWSLWEVQIMVNLIKMNFTRLFKSLIYKLCLLFSCGFAILPAVSRYIEMRNNVEMRNNNEVYIDSSNYFSADFFMFSGALFLIFAAAALIGIFIGTEYSDGTMRNKLAVGHTRSEIYLANFIVSAAANVIILLIFLLLSLGMGLMFLDAPTLDFNQIVTFMLSQVLTMTAFTAIIVLCQMLISNKAIGSVAVLIISLVLLISAFTISAQLKQQEYISSNIPKTNEETGLLEIEQVTSRNPKYITGTKRKIYEFLDNALPASQFNQVREYNSDNLGVMAVYSALTIVLANGIGIIVFRKKDLK